MSDFYGDNIINGNLKVEIVHEIDRQPIQLTTNN
jgi:hypothetical protein